MGYTQYVRQQRDFTEEEWEAILIASQEIVDQVGVPIQYEYDDPSPPLFSTSRIHFNGVEEDGHETFALDRVKTSGFDFCKTARKPYDLPVAAILLWVAYNYPDAIHFSSDGSNEWDYEGENEYEGGFGTARKLLQDLFDMDCSQPPFKD